MGANKERQRRLEKAVAERCRQMTQYHSYTEDEVFTMDGSPVFSVLDFWQFEFGALISMVGTIGEFLVCRALEIPKAENVIKWTGYDVSYKCKRIEVKSTSYIHSWNGNKQSDVRTFSIAPSNNNYWLVKDDSDTKKRSRQSELYVFCLNTQRDYEHFDPLKVDSWEFYVIPTYQINERCDRIGIPDQKTISLNVVKKMTEPAKWTKLKDKIDAVIDDVDQWVDRLDD